MEHHTKDAVRAVFRRRSIDEMGPSKLISDNDLGYGHLGRGRVAPFKIHKSHADRVSVNDMGKIIGAGSQINYFIDSNIERHVQRKAHGWVRKLEIRVSLDHHGRRIEGICDLGLGYGKFRRLDKLNGVGDVMDMRFK